MWAGAWAAHQSRCAPRHVCGSDTIGLGVDCAPRRADVCALIARCAGFRPLCSDWLLFSTPANRNATLRFFIFSHVQKQSCARKLFCLIVKSWRIAYQSKERVETHVLMRTARHVTAENFEKIRVEAVHVTGLLAIIEANFQHVRNSSAFMVSKYVTFHADSEYV